MTKFKFKNKPKGFLYPIRKKCLREFANKSSENYSLIEYIGTAKPDYFNEEISCWIGIAKSNYDENGWSFSIEIKCFKSEYITPWIDEVEIEILKEIKKWTNRLLSNPDTVPRKKPDLYLQFKVKKNILTSSCFEVDNL